MHEREDETFVLLTGRCEFWIEGRSLLRGAFETVVIPKGREHTFRGTGDGPCRHLTILTPGGFKGFFADMARGGFRISEDMEQINASAARHGLRFTGPPLGDPGGASGS